MWQTQSDFHKSKEDYICLNSIWNNQMIKLDVEGKGKNTQISLWDRFCYYGGRQV